MEERKKKVLYISTFSITFFLLVFEQGVFHLCREPAREFPPMTRSCRRALMGKASQGSRGNPWICLSIYPKTRICLFYYSMTFTNSSDIAAAAAKSLQSCPTLCDPIDGGPPGSPVPGILQARTLEWVAISFSNA